ncbi:LAME_0H07338g1_1 [Lachancea meyersii CBS 8951]|uniref:Protein transport protein sec16 n=1 Tax=Lachancea meyersii CBS 8951 TaxID=1266667 RepID=A0A1G4KEY4_9SACH|nr:LAME_0H07338g1_1 [Lachancea meyersii CBS 8951]
MGPEARKKKNQKKKQRQKQKKALNKDEESPQVVEKSNLETLAMENLIKDTMVENEPSVAQLRPQDSDQPKIEIQAPEESQRARAESSSFLDDINDVETGIETSTAADVQSGIENTTQGTNTEAVITPSLKQEPPFETDANTVTQSITYSNEGATISKETPPSDFSKEIENGSQNSLVENVFEMAHNENAENVDERSSGHGTNFSASQAEVQQTKANGTLPRKDAGSEDTTEDNILSLQDPASQQGEQLAQVDFELGTVNNEEERDTKFETEAPSLPKHETNDVHEESAVTVEPMEQTGLDDSDSMKGNGSFPGQTFDSPSPEQIFNDHDLNEFDENDEEAHHDPLEPPAISQIQNEVPGALSLEKISVSSIDDGSVQESITISDSEHPEVKAELVSETNPPFTAASPHFTEVQLGEGEDVDQENELVTDADLLVDVESPENKMRVAENNFLDQPEFVNEEEDASRFEDNEPEGLVSQAVNDTLARDESQNHFLAPELDSNPISWEPEFQVQQDNEKDARNNAVQPVTIPESLTSNAQTHEAKSFANDDEGDEKPLPWEENDDFLSHLGLKDAAAASGNDFEAAHPLAVDETPEWLSQNQKSEENPLPWEVENEDAGDSSVLRSSIGSGDPPKKFSFLENDDDLLDDDDSFLDSDEEPSLNATASLSEGPGSTVPVSNPYLPRNDSNVSTPAVTSTPVVQTNANFAHPVAPLISQTQKQAPSDRKTSRYGPSPAIDEVGGPRVTAVTEPAPIHPAAPSIRPILTEFPPPQNMNRKLDEEKKKSDAYDFPLELASRNSKKPKQPKPFGSVSPAISSSASSINTPGISGAVPSKVGPIVGNSIPVPLNYTGSAPKGVQMQPSFQARDPISAVNPPVSTYRGPPGRVSAEAFDHSNLNMQLNQQTAYQPSLPSKGASNVPAPMSRYAPTSANAELPRKGNAMSPYAPESARVRAFSNVSSGSAVSIGRANSHNIMPAASRFHGQTINNGPPGDQFLRPEAQAPLVPALKTIGLSTLGNQPVSPNTQKRSHARSNSSVYAPAFSSKYAPTVQPQFHLPSQDSESPHYGVSSNYGRPVASNILKQTGDDSSAVHRVADAQAVDPSIAFHRQFPLFRWGSSSKVAFGLPRASDANSYFTTGGQGLDVCVASYDAIVKPSDSFKCFPGPLLKNKTKSKEVQKWITDSCLQYTKDQPMKDLTLYNILSAKITPDVTLRDIAKALYNPDELLPFLSQPASRKKNAFNARKLSANDQLRVFAALQTGNHEHALELALAEGDYALALMLGSLLGKKKWSDVVNIYLHEEFIPVGSNDTDFSGYLLTLIFQVSVGNAKRVVSELEVNPLKVNWAINNWKMIVAAILNNVKHQSDDPASDALRLTPFSTEFMVEFGAFLHQNGMRVEGVTCFVVADLPVSDHELIVGSGVKFSSVGDENSWEGMLLTEVYEFSLAVKDPKYPGSIHSLVQKLVHSLALIECGMTADASKYADAVSQSLRSLPKNSPLACAVELRLNFVSSRLVGTNGSWLGKPKLSQVWGQLDKSFNKFIGGDSEEAQNDTTGKIFESFTPSNSRNASLLDLSNQPLPFNPVDSLNSSITPAFPPLQRPQIPTNVSSGGLLKGRNGSSVAESKYDPSRNQWAATPNQPTTIEMPASTFDSPVQSILHKSPIRPKDQLPAAETPPPLFSTLSSSNKYISRKVPLSGEGVADNALPPHAHSRPKRSYRSEKPVNAALLADLCAAPPPPPPPISGSTGSYTSRRNSAQSRSSFQSKSSNLSSPKHTPMSFPPAAADLSTELTNASSHRVDQQPRINIPIPSNKISQNADFEDGSLDGDVSMAQTVETLNEEVAGTLTQEHYRKHHAVPLPVNVGTAAMTSEYETDNNALGTQMTGIEASQSQEVANFEDETRRQPGLLGDTEENVQTGTNNMKYAHGLKSSQVPSQTSSGPNVMSGKARNPYAPVEVEKETKALHNPYAPSNSQPLETDNGASESPGDLAQKTSDAELNMFSYGGYKLSNTDVGESGAVSTNDVRKNSFSQSPVGESGMGSGDNVSMKDPQESPNTQTDATSPQGRFEPVSNKKLNLVADDGGQLFSGNSAPVIRPSSNPSFRPFTPASTPGAEGAEEYYEDIIENETDDEEDEAELEKQRVEAEKQKSKEKAKKDATEAKGDRNNNQNGASWFGWLRKDPNEKKPVKAKLGHQNTFYYDDKLQRWVNKNATEEEKQQISAPPPPPPIITKKLEGSPKVKPRSGSVAGGAAARTAAFTPSSNVLEERSASSSEAAGPSQSVSPSSTPSVSLSGKKANNIDDLMSLVGNAGNQSGARRKKKGARGYVNVMNNM